MWARYFGRSSHIIVIVGPSQSLNQIGPTEGRAVSDEAARMTKAQGRQPDRLSRRGRFPGRAADAGGLRSSSGPSSELKKKFRGVQVAGGQDRGSSSAGGQAPAALAAKRGVLPPRGFAKFSTCGFVEAGGPEGCAGAVPPTGNADPIQSGRVHGLLTWGQGHGFPSKPSRWAHARDGGAWLKPERVRSHAQQLQVVYSRTSAHDMSQVLSDALEGPPPSRATSRVARPDTDDVRAPGEAKDRRPDPEVSRCDGQQEPTHNQLSRFQLSSTRGKLAMPADPVA